MTTPEETAPEETAFEIRAWLLWAGYTRTPTVVDKMPDAWKTAAETLLDEKRIKVEDGNMVAAVLPDRAKRSREDGRAVAASCAIVLLDLEQRDEISFDYLTGRIEEFGITRRQMQAALTRLSEDGLVTVRNKTVTAVYAFPFRGSPKTPEMIGIKPVEKAEPEPPPRTTTGHAQATRRAPPATETKTSPKPVKEEPEPTAGVETLKPESETVRESAPVPGVPVTLEQAFLSRITEAVEAQVTMALNPQYRHRTLVGVSPLHDTMRRIAVALVTEDEPTLASRLTLHYLSKGQRAYLDSALEEGAKLGAFARTGGSGRDHRGAKYTLADPTMIGVTWDEVNGTAHRIRAQRQVEVGV
jgi:hypothetical protein